MRLLLSKFRVSCSSWTLSWISITDTSVNGWIDETFVSFTICDLSVLMSTMRPFYLPGLPMNHFLLLIFRSSQALLHGQLSLCTGRIQIKVLTTLPFLFLFFWFRRKRFQNLRSSFGGKFRFLFKYRCWYCAIVWFESDLCYAVNCIFHKFDY